MGAGDGAPTATMRANGFKLVTMGRGYIVGDQRMPTAEDKARAIRLNEEWDRVRLGKGENPEKVYPPGTVGDGYVRALAMRAAERKKNNIIWTHQQEKRDDWPRAWRWIEPIFGDVYPKTIEPEDFISIDPKTGEATGLIPYVEQQGSIGERHRAVKVWRALWKKMGVMKILRSDERPLSGVCNSAPNPRSAIWLYDEVRRLVKRAIRMKYYGLAALLAVAWDSQLSPIDARTLTTAQMRRDGRGVWFEVARTKTGAPAIATLSTRTTHIFDAYLASHGCYASGRRADLPQPLRPRLFV